jgi:hypothetical protein
MKIRSGGTFPQDFINLINSAVEIVKGFQLIGENRLPGFMS